MMHFLLPAGLFALLAVAIPIAIHFLSSKTGKRKKLGSIRFLESSQSAQLGNLRFTELLLLLVRAALLVIVGTLLAAPVWFGKHDLQGSKTAGWAVVAPEVLASAHKPELHAGLDSLVAAGYELHLLAPGMPQFQPGDKPAAKDPAANYWSLFRDLDLALPASLPLVLFIPDRLGGYRGERPATARTVEWHLVNEHQQNWWIEQARIANADSVHLIVGMSDVHHSVFQRITAAVSNREVTSTVPGNPPIELTAVETAGGRILRLHASDDEPEDNKIRLAESRGEVMVGLLHDAERAEDATYVGRALESVREFAKVPLVVKSGASDAAERFWEDAAILFWLSSDTLRPEVREHVQRQGGLLVTDASSREHERCESVIVDNQQRKLAVLRRRAPMQKQRITIWIDGFGNPLLIGERVGAGMHLQFSSRFHPLWNDLVLRDSFPEWILSIAEQREEPMVGATAAVRRSDRRRIGAAQATARHIAGADEAETTPLPTTSLHLSLVFAGMMLFGLERWLAERKAA